MPRHDSWADAWVCKHVVAHDKVSAATPLGSNLIEACIDEMPHPVKVASVSVPVLTAADIREVYIDQAIEFVINVVRDALVEGDAIRFAEAIPIGLGGVGDFYVAVNERSFKKYVPKETRFILRGLRQHTHVKSVERLNDRAYKIVRHGHTDMRILALNQYDLTADALRDGIDKYGVCDVGLASNPNCRLSGECIEAAKHCGVLVLKWNQLLGGLSH